MTLDSASDRLNWYVLHTKPKQEDRAIYNLEAWSVESFTPKLEQIRFNFYTGKREDVIKPLFPRYIFARFCVRSLIGKVRYTRGVNNVVSFGDEPTPVEDEVIELVRSRIEKDGLVRIRESLRPGDRVMVKDLPLRSLKGVFERQMNDKDRVMILLSTVGYQAHLELPRILVKRMKHPAEPIYPNPLEEAGSALQ